MGELSSGIPGRRRVALRAVADTHAVIWYLYEDRRLSPAARATIERAVADGDRVGVSAITFAELVYLTERGRIPADALNLLLKTLEEPNTVFSELPLDRAVAAAMPEIKRDEVPEMPDRIIAATAHFHRVPLISRDRRISSSALPTIW